MEYRQGDHQVIQNTERGETYKRIFEYFRMFAFLMAWIFSLAAFLLCKKSNSVEKMLLASEAVPYVMNLERYLPTQGLYGLTVKGLEMEGMPNSNRFPKRKGQIEFEFLCKQLNGRKIKISESIDLSSDLSGKHIESLEKTIRMPPNLKNVTLTITTKSIEGFAPISFKIFPEKIPLQKSATLAGLLLFLLCMLLVWDIVNRVYAATLMAVLALGVLSCLRLRPSLETLTLWIDTRTMVLLFSLMIFVGILSNTGLFDKVAVFAYRLSRGHAWPMLYVICLITVLLSALLDNVTVILLIIPVAIRLCEVMSLNVPNVLIVIMVLSNIGGGLTPISNPPNIILSSSVIVKKSGIDFKSFIWHMFPLFIICSGVAILQARLQLQLKGISKQSPDNREKSERDLTSVKSSDHENHHPEQANRKGYLFGLKPIPNFEQSLADMETNCKIRDKPLLIKCGVSLFFVIAMLTLHLVPPFQNLPFEWTALLAALLLLTLANKIEFDHILAQVQWSTLVFLAALFVFMESLSEMGLIKFIGMKAATVLTTKDHERHLGLSMLSIVWISGCFTAFVDNIPTTQMILRLFIQMKVNPTLIWSLVAGTCLGANGTLVGSFSNLIAAQIAAKHGYKINFFDFVKIGLPTAVSTLLVATIYLQLMHTVLGLF